MFQKYSFFFIIIVAECTEYDDLFGAKPTSIGKILMEKFQKLKTPCAPC